MRRSRIKAKPNIGPKPTTRSNTTTQKQTPTETTSSKNAEESTDNSAQAENSTTTQKTRSPVKVASPKPTATSPARATRNENLPKSPGKTVGIENSHKSPGKNAPQTENTTPAPQEKGFPSPPKPSFTTPLTRLQPAEETQRSFSELRATPAPSLKIADKSTDPKPRIVGRFGKLKPKPNLTLRARHVSTSENEEESRTKTPTSAPRAPHIAFVEDVEPVVKPLVASVEVPPSPVRHRGTAMDDSFRVPAGVSEDDLYKKPKRRRKYRKIDWGDDPPDKTKFTMSDLIHWNPKKNRMKPKEDKLRKLEEEEEEREEEEEEKEEEEAEKQGEEERSSTPVPQVKIGPDGSIVLNEESMVIEQNSPAAEESFINTDYRQEGESDVSYASFRKRCSGKKWSTKETLRFYKALSVVGTDFSLIEQIFKTRTRREIKAKWKREERENRHLIDKALREHVCDFDMSILRAESSDEESEPAAKRRRRSGGSVDSRGSNEGTDGPAKTTGRKGTGRARKKKGVSENPETPTLAPPPVERQTRYTPISTPIPGGPPSAPPDAPPRALPDAPTDAPLDAPPDAPSGDAPATPAATPGRPAGVPQPALFTPLVSPILRRSENSDQRLTIPLPNQGDLIIVKDKNSAQTPNQQIVHIYMISPPNKPVSNVPLQTLQSFIKPLDSSQNQNLVLNLANLTQGAVVSKSGITGIDKIITSQTGSSSNTTGSGSTPSRLVWRTSRSSLETSQIVGESLRIADLTPSKHGKNPNVSTPNRGGENSNFVQSRNPEPSTNVDNTDCSFSEQQSNERTENTSMSVMDISTEPDDLPTFTKSRRAKFVPKLTNLRRTQTQLDEEPSTSTDNTVEWTRISVDDFINPDKSTVERPSLDVEPVASPSIFDSEPFFQSPPPRTRNPYEFADRVQPIVEELVAGSELYETGRSGSNQGTNVDKNVQRTRDVTEKDKLEGHNSSKVSDKTIESETRNVSEDSKKKDLPSTSSKTYDVRHSNVKEGFVEHVKLYTSSAERKRRDSMISYSSQVSEDAFGGGPQKLVKKQGGGGWRRRKWRKKWKGRRYYNNNSAPKPPKPKPFDYSSFGSPRTMDESYPVAENVEILSEEEDWTGDEVGHHGQRDEVGFRDEVDRQRHGVGGRRGEVVMDRQFRFGESPKETSMGSGELFSNDVSYIKKKSKNTPTKESEPTIQKELVASEKVAPHTKTSKRTRSEKKSSSERKRMINEGFDNLSEEERTELAKVSAPDPKQAPVFAVLPSPTARILSPVPVPRVLSPRLDESFSDSESGKTRRKVRSPTAILQSPNLQAFGSPTTMPRVSESPISVFGKSVTSSKSQKASGPFSYNPLFFSPPNLVIDEETVEEIGGEESPERSSVCHKSVVSSAKKKNSDSNEGTSNDSTDNDRGTKKNPKASKNGGKGVKSSSVKPTSEESQIGTSVNSPKTKATKPKAAPTNRKALKNSKSGQVTENDESVDEGQLGRGKSASLAANAAIPQKSGVHEKRQSRSRTKSLRESESEKQEITPSEPASKSRQAKNQISTRERKDSLSAQNSANDQATTETPEATRTPDKKSGRSQDSAKERKDSTTTRDSTKNHTFTVTRESTESSDKQVVASASAQVEERTTASKRRSRVAIKPKLPSNRNSQNVGSAQEKDTSSGGEGVTVTTVAGGPSPKNKSPTRKSVQIVEQTTDFTTPRKTRSPRRTSESCDNVTKTGSDVIQASTDVTMACERRGASTDRPPEMAGDRTGSEVTGDSGTSTATGRARRARIAVKPVLESRKRTRSPSKEESQLGNDHESDRGRKSSRTRKPSESKNALGENDDVDDSTVSTDDVTMSADDVTKSRGSRRQSPAKSRSPRRSKTSESDEPSTVLSKSKNVMTSPKSSTAIKISPSKVVESEESSEIMVHITETKVQISDLDVKSEPTPTPGKQRRSRLTIKPSLGPRKPAASTSEASTPATTSLALPISTTSSVPMTTKPSVTKATISSAPAASVPIATPRLPLAAFGEEESSSVSMGNLHVALSPVTTKCAEEDSNKPENLRKDDRTLEKSTTRRRAKAKIVPNVPVRRISVEVSEKVREKVSEKVSENVPEVVQSTDSTEEISKKVTPPIAKIGQAVERIPSVSEDSEENDETSRVSKTAKIGKQQLQKKKKETMKSPQALRVSELKSRMSNLREQVFEKKSLLPPTTGITPKRVQKPMSERAEKESISQGSKLVVQAQVHVPPTLDSIRKSSLDKFGPRFTNLSDSPSSTGTEEEESSLISVGNARKLSEKKQNSVSENKPASTPLTSSSTPLTSRTPVQRLRGAKQLSEMRTGFVGGLDLGTRLEGMDTVKNLNLASKLDVNTEDSDETSSITLSSSSKTTISKSSPASTKRRPQPNLTPKRLTTPSSPIATVAMSPKTAGPSIATVAMSPKSPKSTNPLLGVDWAAFKGGLTIQHPQTGQTIVLCQDDEV